MITIKPFSALRPTNALVDKCAALPYDVMSSSEAREMVKGNPYSFLRIDRAEINLDPGVDIYSEEVYNTARDILKKFEDDGVYINDGEKKYYFYRQIMGEQSQTGIVGCASIDDYLENRIKKHEFTRADKEVDRIKHVDTCSAQTGPIFLAYKQSKTLDSIIVEQTKKAPLYDFVAEDGVRHTVWTTDSSEIDAKIESAFASLDALYIADGHHRCASAVRVGQRRRGEGEYDKNAEFNFFLSVIFPCDQLKIMDYNRVIADLNGNTSEEFMAKMSEKFVVEEATTSPYAPKERHTFGMYLDNKWYKVTAKPEFINENDPVECLDVSILQNNLITPILNIADPRTDKRIDFVGGIRGLGELERRCKEGMKLAFAMYPTSLNELMDIADAGQVMPPKSTWFEPKLLSGLFIHKLS